MNEKRENETLMEKMEEDAPEPGMMSDSPATIMGQPEGAESSMLNSDLDQDQNSHAKVPPVKIDYTQTNLDEMEELIESVVEEKWQSLIENFGDIGLWKDKVRTEILSIKQELVRMENRLENIQKAVLGKVKSYDEHMIEVGSEIKALEKVFGKIIDPLTTNIKELDRITNELKKR